MPFPLCKQVSSEQWQNWLQTINSARLLWTKRKQVTRRNYFCSCLFLLGPIHRLRGTRDTKLKYLGCIFLDGSCEIDISPSVGKFYAQFIIMAILGKYDNEMAAVHLTNSYCVRSLLYACEIWLLSNSSAHSVRVALNNLFRRIFNCCWRENSKSLLFYCGTLPALYTVDQRRILFYKKLKYHSSILITRSSAIAEWPRDASCQ